MESEAQPQSHYTSGESPFVVIFRHNLWANLQLIDACAALDQTQLETSVVGVYGSIYDTLRHVTGAEQGYLILLTGQEPSFRLRREHRPELAVIREQARLAGERLIAYAASVATGDVGYGDDDEDENIVWPIPAGFLLNQVINHATEHRAQVMVMLTQLGIEPPDLSGWRFMDETVTITPVPRPKPATGG
jgi:uncharacterized damage-inducible protein DinB